jgi:hypothetical protein
MPNARREVTVSRICYLLFATLFSAVLSSGVLTKPKILLRIEGGFDLALSLIFYQWIHANWLLFILLLLVPDLAILGFEEFKNYRSSRGSFRPYLSLICHLSLPLIESRHAAV